MTYAALDCVSSPHDDIRQASTPFALKCGGSDTATVNVVKHDGMRRRVVHCDRSTDSNEVHPANALSDGGSPRIAGCSNVGDV